MSRMLPNIKIKCLEVDSQGDPLHPALQAHERALWGVGLLKLWMPVFAHPSHRDYPSQMAAMNEHASTLGFTLDQWCKPWVVQEAKPAE